MKSEFPKVYLGDSVYMTHDGFQVVLTTENGDRSGTANIIYLKPEVLREMQLYLHRWEILPLESKT